MSQRAAAILAFVFFAIAFTILQLVDTPRPWWLTGAGYLAAAFGLGAMLEWLRESRAARGGPRTTPRQDKLISSYNKALDRKEALIAPESSLPAAKSEIRAALERARDDPFYRLARGAVERSLSLLETFVPDDDVETTERFVNEAVRAATAKDEPAYAELISGASDQEQRALAAVLRAVLDVRR